MRASFRYEDSVPVLEVIQRMSSLNLHFEVSLVSREQYRERSERNICRCLLCNTLEYLAVCDDKRRLLAKRIEYFFEAVFFHNHSCRIRLEYVADRLLLREDEPALRGSFVDRNYENNQIVRFDKVAYYPLICVFLRRQCRNPVLEFIDISLICSADPHDLIITDAVLVFSAKCCFQFSCDIRTLFLTDKIRFIQHDSIRNLLVYYPAEDPEVFIGKAAAAVHNKQGNVTLVEHLIGFPDSKFTQLALIVESRSVDHNNRTERQQLHSFLNRVCSSTEHIRYYCKVLPCQCVDHARLTGIAPSEYSYMYTFTRRCVVHAHFVPPRSVSVCMSPVLSPFICSHWPCMAPVSGFQFCSLAVITGIPFSLIDIIFTGSCKALYS